MPLKQHQIPEHFPNRWVVAGAPWETPLAGRECLVVRYEVDERGRDLVRVRFTERLDLFDPEEALLTPWQLFPVLPPPHDPSIPRNNDEP